MKYLGLHLSPEVAVYDGKKSAESRSQNPGLFMSSGFHISFSGLFYHLCGDNAYLPRSMAPQHSENCPQVFQEVYILGGVHRYCGAVLTGLLTINM